MQLPSFWFFIYWETMPLCEKFSLCNELKTSTILWLDLYIFLKQWSFELPTPVNMTIFLSLKACLTYLYFSRSSSSSWVYILMILFFILLFYWDLLISFPWLALELLFDPLFYFLSATFEAVISIIWSWNWSKVGVYEEI